MFGILKTAAPSVYHNLSSAQFGAGMRQTGALLLDVRRPDEFAQGHLPGAVNMDVSDPDFAQRIGTLDPKRQAFVYCRSGARSAKAAKELGVAGFTHVFNLAGGMLEWPSKLGRSTLRK